MTSPSSLALARAVIWSIKAVTCSFANAPTFRVSMFSMPGMDGLSSFAFRRSPWMRCLYLAWS
eukprot:9867367-Prorocentrum_lima.AAC.1